LLFPSQLPSSLYFSHWCACSSTPGTKKA
jgi:hypothetical protein